LSKIKRKASQYNRGLGRLGKAVGNTSQTGLGTKKLLKTIGTSKRKVKTQKDVAKAYRDMARKYHPDKGGGPERIREINAAMEEIKRTKYYGHLKQAMKPYTTYQQKGKKIFKILEANSNFQGATQPNVNLKYFRSKIEIRDFVTKMRIKKKLAMGKLK